MTEQTQEEVTAFLERHFLTEAHLMSEEFDPALVCCSLLVVSVLMGLRAGLTPTSYTHLLYSTLQAFIDNQPPAEKHA